MPFIDENVRLINLQASKISQLNKDLQKAYEEIRRLEILEKQYNSWMIIQHAVGNSESLKEEWEKFLFLCKMSLQDNVPGLTEAAKYAARPNYITMPIVEQLDLFDDNNNC